MEEAANNWNSASTAIGKQIKLYILSTPFFLCVVKSLIWWGTFSSTSCNYFLSQCHLPNWGWNAIKKLLSWVYYLDVILNSPKKFTWKHITAGRVKKQSDLGNLWPFMAYSWSFFSCTHGCLYQLVILFLFRCHLCWVSFVQGDVRRLLLGIQVCKEVSVELFCVDSWVCVCLCQLGSQGLSRS